MKPQGCALLRSTRWSTTACSAATRPRPRCILKQCSSGTYLQAMPPPSTSCPQAYSPTSQSVIYWVSPVECLLRPRVCLMLWLVESLLRPRVCLPRTSVLSSPRKQSLPKISDSLGTCANLRDLLAPQPRDHQPRRLHLPTAQQDNHPSFI